MLKAILFDFDGVLTLNKDDIYSVSEELVPRLGMSLEEIERVLGKQFQAPLYTGKQSLEDAWGAFCKEIGLDMSMDELYEIFALEPMNEEVLALARKVKAKGFKIGIITTNVNERMKVLVDKHKLDELFDVIVTSVDAGYTKRGEHGSEEIFRMALRKIGVAPEEAVFIDNTMGNLDIPKDMGLSTIFYNHDKDTVSLLVERLKGLGINL